MRTTNSIKNGIISIIMALITLFVGFFSQKIFLSTLGTEYLGLNGLFSNILSILSVTELGFGTAIVYNLYKPIAEKNENKILILINFYKNVYRIIAVVILILGLITIPFLGTIVGETTIKSIKFLFFLSLLEIVFSYLLSYKRSILYADQKNYIINFVHIFYVIFLNALQILFLYKTHNYVIYLILRIVFRILENIVITIIANKRYPFIKENCKQKITKDEKNNIVLKVKGLFFHNIGSAIVQGTDNILISKLFNVIIVGLYSNYFLIINALNNLITQLFQSFTSSVGNLLITEDANKSYQIYKSMYFLNSLIYCACSCILYSVINKFIILWLGKEYLLSDFVVLIIIINFYIQGMRKTSAIFKNASGTFYEDRFVPIIESILNIIFSLIFAKILGLAGIFVGTICSSTILFFYSYPLFVYKKILKKNYIKYLIDLIKPSVLFIISMIITNYLKDFIYINNMFLSIILTAVIIGSIIFALYLITYFKSGELNYYKQIFLKVSKKDEK